MRLEKIPFNIKYLSTDRARIRGILPVTVLDMYQSNSGELHPQGLYSNEVFGRVGTPERNTRHGLLNTRATFLHPKTFEELKRLKGLYADVMAGRVFAKWDNKVKDFTKSDVLDGETGYSFFMSHYGDLKLRRNASAKRDLRIDVVNKYRNGSDIYDYLPIWPAGLRDVKPDADGRPIEEDINKIYRRILMLSNSVSSTLIGTEDPALDRTRWSLQAAIQDLWDYFIAFNGGKNGFFQAKWGSRKVVYGTTNVITSMDTATDDLDGSRSIDLTTTMVGLHQYMKFTEPMFVDWAIPSGIMRDVIETISNSPRLINTKTLKLEPVDLGEYERVAWGTAKGRSGLIDHYKDLGVRHKPMMIGKHYAALIYRTRKNLKVFRDIDSIPDHIDKSMVRPITWAEYMYYEAFQYNGRINAFVNRYPITGDGSVYIASVYLKTTVKGERLRVLDDQWRPNLTELEYPEFPDTANEAAFMDTSSPHLSQLLPLNADFDGDRSSTTAVMSEEAVAEARERLDSIETYLTPSGTLRQLSSNDLSNWVFRNFTGFR